ncbi:protein-L-isoaspartate(D-aspartate) O-methyltransferase [Actinomadura barringtoniae]|uniref:Protein-L-isoaspartate O-methyltransferase n=1 Tax=Actinomadura barringtoniae TaxID=1427535 RepID=A0A939PCC0_9ACTN|nr:methyltransferase domain-containing protein [Actinomadura barringtoniae]MBO2446644.1 protein-L-isoaspartate(D-aspartate) O-methyltransferase [Actinomadura barringtoniae]
MTTQERIDGLADALTVAGMLTDQSWRNALKAVPRHVFAPETGWAVPDRPRYEGFAIDRDADAATWWDAVYSNTAIAIQLDDGAGDPLSGAGQWTSSCSAPGIVVVFLQELRPLDHHRVLEIGTGTGWTAGLLTWRLGAANVTSVEIDAALAARAAGNLKVAGLAPNLVVGDGALGHPDGAPYDRVHVTCAVERVPHSWVAQCRPGGVLVLPWSPGWGIGHLARLTATGDGRAIGGLTGPAGFMMLRSQRRPLGTPEASDPADRSSTLFDPRLLLAESAGAEVAIAALVPGVRSHVEAAPDGSCRVWAVDTHGPSWTCAQYEPGRTDYPVQQHGPRRLWNEVETAYLRWVAWGRPDRERFGLTVTPDAQEVWLDTPDSPIRP